jgi:hypothetical protein
LGKSLFNKWYGKKWISTLRRLKLNPCLSPCRKINSQEIKYIKERHEAEHSGSCLAILATQEAETGRIMV